MPVMQATSPRILITRPLHQAQQTAAVLEQHGFTPVIFPVLTTDPIAAGTPEMMALQQALQALPQADWLIFVSANAVEFGWPHVLEKGGLPKSAQIAAIGQATARALKLQGVENICTSSSGNDSEALLALPSFT